jgi:hypothetical protein
MSGEYNLSGDQLGDYLPGMAPEQDDLKGAGFVKVYRGLHAGFPYTVRSAKDVDLGNLGTHWSTSRGVAQSFAASSGSSLLPPGYLVEGWVHPRHIADVKNNPEDAMRYGNRGIFGKDSGEKEATVRDGAPVRVTGMTKVYMKDDSDDGMGEVDFTEKPVVNFKSQIARSRSHEHSVDRFVR